jgi:sugar lactone lactonase YvrE
VATTNILCDGIYFGEGPRWHDGRLWFSDFYAHAVRTVDDTGRCETVVEVPGQPSGLGWLPDGRLLVVSMTDRRVLRLDDGHLALHADLSDLATFHCNDMLVDGAGRAYVGNFGFDFERSVAERGVPATLADPTPAKLALVHPDGRVEIAADALAFPNGMAQTPDGSTLIVAESFGLRLTAFDIDHDGRLSNRRVWADLNAAGVGPDGICLDADGAVWVANAFAAEAVRVAEGGDVLDRVQTTQTCFACALGGPDRTTLYCLTAASASAQQAAAAPTGRIETAPAPAPGVSP